MRTRYLKLLLVALLISSTAHADTTANFTLPSKVNISITESTIDPSHPPTCNVSGHKVPITDNDAIPKTFVKRITATYMGRTYDLDSTCMYDAWGKRPLEVKGVIRYFGGSCCATDYCTFRGIFSDASESFVAEWVVGGGIARRTVLTSSSDIVQLFMKNIDASNCYD